MPFSESIGSRFEGTASPMTQKTSQHPMISRRALLKKATGIAGLSALASVIVVEPALAGAPKFSHKKAQYQYQPRNGDKCSVCRFFQPPNACSIVQSPISPDGWCEFFAAKPKS